MQRTTCDEFEYHCGFMQELPLAIVFSSYEENELVHFVYVIKAKQSVPLNYDANDYM